MKYGAVSPSVRTTTSLRGTPGEKKLVPANVSRAAKVVAVAEYPLGGGRSTPTVSVRPARKSRSLLVGKTFGSTRSVIDAIPDGTSGIASRMRWAAATERASRVGPPVSDARIESEVSTT